MSCKHSRQYYVCAKADYHGCCEVDPCSTGFCPFDSDGDDGGDNSGGGGGDTGGDDSNHSTPSDLYNGSLETEMSPGIALATTTITKTRKTASAATTFTARPSTMETHVSMTVSSTSSLSTMEILPATITSSPTSPATNQTSSPTSSPAEENASSSATPNSPSSGDSSSNKNKGAIGGAVAGGVALAILLALIILSCCRSRGKQNRRFTLLRWYGPQYSPRLRGYGRGKTAARGSGCAEGGCKCGTHSNCCGGKGGSGQAYMNPYNIDTTSTQPQNQPQNHNPVTPTNTSPSLNASTLNSTSRLLPRTPPSITSSPEKHPYKNQQHYTIPSYLSPPPFFPLLPLTGTTDPIRSRVSPTPELGDTGFYRQRVELATYSQSELINIPPGERVRRYQPRQQVRSQFQHQLQTQAQSQFNQQNQPQQQCQQETTQGRNRKHIITPDGAVLAANFERFPGCQDHATSFTQCYDGSGFSGLGVDFEDELPGYCPMDYKMDENAGVYANVSVDEKDVVVGVNGVQDVN